MAEELLLVQRPCDWIMDLGDVVFTAEVSSDYKHFSVGLG